jgi:hypothetical protein
MTFRLKPASGAAILGGCCRKEACGERCAVLRRGQPWRGAATLH